MQVHSRILLEVNYGKSNFNNNRINDTIYKQISGIRDSAFINYLLVPTICMFTLLLMCMIGWVLSLI